MKVTMTNKKIADAIIIAQKLHEDSWDFDAKNQNFAEYKRSREDCFIEACDIIGLEKDIWYVLSLANHWYNDLQAWAEQVSQGLPFDDLLTKAAANGEIKEDDDGDDE